MEHIKGNGRRLKKTRDMRQYTPRPYQQAAHDAAFHFMRKSVKPCLIEAATGAGKSIIIAMIAETLHKLSKGKRVLCLAPSRELVLQNSAKYAATGEPFSIYSASIAKSLRHPVVFATEGTFKKVAERMGKEFAGVVLDEAHRITPTIKGIIDDMKKGNPTLRVCGLTATPYRLGDGYIYLEDEDGRRFDASKAMDPYFDKLVYAIRAKELIGAGFLTPVTMAGAVESYDTIGLEVRMGRFTGASVDKAFHGHGRLTSQIVGQIVEESRGRRGVMIFAATVRHAKEVLASLPKELARMIGGSVNMKKSEREALVTDFHAQKFKYLISVGTMTTGVDFSHVDVIALMRATESISLMQQMIGRGLRLHEGKDNCLLLDFAGNIERHSPDGDVFTPQVRTRSAGEPEGLEAACPECNRVNIFSARPNEEGYGVDAWGYFTLPDGSNIETEYGAIPAHFGRRCIHEDAAGERCSYRWTFKECEACGVANDIAARYCTACRGEIVDPNKKLAREFKKFKRDVTQWQCDLIEEISYHESISQAGNPMTVVELRAGGRSIKAYYTAWRTQYVDGIAEKVKDPWRQSEIDRVTAAIDAGPRTITYMKDGNFWRLDKFNEKTDEEKKDEISACLNKKGKTF